MTRIKVPAFSLVVLIGPSGSGKSTFARRFFQSSEIVSSDFCRELISDLEDNPAANADAFELLHFIAGKRLKARRLTVIDATNVRAESRRPLIALAREYDSPTVAIVFNLPERVCLEYNVTRSDRVVSKGVVRKQLRDLKQSVPVLADEGFSCVQILNDVEEIEATEIERK